jgi:SH3-like domain-containing protein
MIEGHVLQQLGGLWRWLQDQSPARQALILATPVVAAMLLVLGGLIVWTVAAPTVAPRPTAVVQASLTAVPPTNVVAVIATASPSTVALLPTVLVPSHDPALTPTVVPTPEPTPTPTPEPARSARIVNTEGQGANMRRAPSVSAQRVRLIVEGTVVELIGGEQQGDGYTWRNVRDVDGSAGYVIADYLQPIQGPPGATPVLPPPSIQVEDITSPVARGGEATLTIITRPGVRCELRVLLFGPATLPREGLETKTADGDGVCSWTWTVPEDVVPGTWRYRISAGEGEGRATREIPFVVT